MKIGVLCSGGDAPGMNPCLRAIVRAGDQYGDKIVGIRRGYQGVLDGEFWGGTDRAVDVREVSGWTSKGGACFNSSRCPEMRTEEGLQKAVEMLRRHRFGALVAIGGNGTLAGALEISKRWEEGQVIGIPGTIDNDLLGTDYTIGFATAVKTGVDAVDKLRDTAGSHDMMFLVEVMGRDCGDLATAVAIAGGCELATIPETHTSIETIVEKLHRFKALGKRSTIMIVAEGDEYGGAYKTMDALKKAGAPYEMRAVVLGHVMRGGSPVPLDRILATRLGRFAVDALHLGESGKMVGEIAGQLALTPFEEAIAAHKTVAPELIELLERVSV